MKKIKCIVILLVVIILNVIGNDVVYSESKSQRIDLIYGHKLLLDNGGYIFILKSGLISYYDSHEHPRMHFPKDTQVIKDGEGAVKVILKEGMLTLGNYTGITNMNAESDVN